jgi:hypothetical protein
MKQQIMIILKMIFVTEILFTQLNKIPFEFKFKLINSNIPRMFELITIFNKLNKTMVTTLPITNN